MSESEHLIPRMRHKKFLVSNIKLSNESNILFEAYFKLHETHVGFSYKNQLDLCIIEFKNLTTKYWFQFGNYIKNPRLKKDTKKQTLFSKWNPEFPRVQKWDPTRNKEADNVANTLYMIF